MVGTSGYGTLRLWGIDGGQEARQFRRHDGAVQSCAFSPGGRYALSASNDCTLGLWEVGNGRMIARWYTDASLYCCAFNPDGRHVMAGDAMGGVHLLTIVGLAASAPLQPPGDVPAKPAPNLLEPQPDDAPTSQPPTAEQPKRRKLFGLF
jgi:WD40 repeat protein